MLPALPTGRKWKSGARPSTSQISNAAVFWPSMRTGLIELTTSTPGCAPSSRTSRSASSKLPSQRDDLRAIHARLRQLAQRDLAVRQQHHAAQSRAARIGRGRGGGIARARANDQLRTCSPRACVIAAVMPRSLKEQVGLTASYFRIKFEAAARLLRQARRGDQRRVALLQRDDRHALAAASHVTADSAPARRARRKEYCEASWLIAVRIREELASHPRACEGDRD